jgi:hypothetical protein
LRQSDPTEGARGNEVAMDQAAEGNTPEITTGQIVAYAKEETK